MRSKLIIFLIAFNSSYSFGQKRLDHIVPHVRRSDYIITKDTNQINFFIADSILKTIGLKVYRKSNHQRIYIDGRFFFPYSITFSKYKLADTAYAFGFTCNYVPSRVGYAARNISRFYMSAYMQDMDKNYKLKHSFIKLPIKNMDDFWRRNWISMGYGMSYSVKNNPFASAGAAYTGLGYFFDALTTFMIVGGPLLGKTTKDKIGVPILGIAINLLGKKYLIGRASELNIESYNNIVNSKYGIPNDIKH